MKKIILTVLVTVCIINLSAQQFIIPNGAVLLESTEFKNNGVTYIIEQRYRLTSGETMYVYYDTEGSNSITFQKIEQTPILAIGTDINIPGMPGYREFNFGDDRRKLVQFMKIFKLGELSYDGRIKTPSLSDHIFTLTASIKDEFILLLDLYDETWVLEHLNWGYSGLTSTWTTKIARTNRYND